MLYSKTNFYIKFCNGPVMSLLALLEFSPTPPQKHESVRAKVQHGSRKMVHIRDDGCVKETDDSNRESSL